MTESQPSRIARVRRALSRPAFLREMALLFAVFGATHTVLGLFDPEVTSASGYFGIAFGLYALARVEEVDA